MIKTQIPHAIGVIYLILIPLAYGRSPNSNGQIKSYTTKEVSGNLSETPLPNVPLKTLGRYIIDSSGRRFKLASINWYGASDVDYVVGGLDTAPLLGIVDAIKRMGFNSIRLPFSNAMLHHAASIDPSKIKANPQLFGKSAIEIFDSVIEALSDAGIVVIINNHTSNAIWCCNYEEDGLWYTSQYSEQDWINDWLFLAQRYRKNPMVVAADLRNEVRIARWRSTIIPRIPNWGAQPNDWRLAAEKAANAIHHVNPEMLIFVEGINFPRYHLRGVRKDPVRLEIPYKLVYAAHNYPFTRPGTTAGPAYGQMPWNEFRQIMDEEWGFVTSDVKPFTAPVWLSEFGMAPSQTDRAWFENVMKYLEQKDFDWGYWALNVGPRPNGEFDNYGLLQEDWLTPTQDFRLEYLQKIQKPTSGPGITEPLVQNYNNRYEVIEHSTIDHDQRLQNKGDWAPYYVKSTCNQHFTLQGVAHAEHRLLHTLCHESSLLFNESVILPDQPLFDDGGDSTWVGTHLKDQDWSPGANKIECPLGFAVTGLGTKSNGLRPALYSVLCSPMPTKEDARGCHTITIGNFDNTQNSASGDWAPFERKSQCADDQWLVGVSFKGRKPMDLLCCNKP